MSGEKTDMRSAKSDVSLKSVRTSVSLPKDDYLEIESLAALKKVSVAWVVRDAIDQYLIARRPLLTNRSARNTKSVSARNLLNGKESSIRGKEAATKA